MQVEIVKEQVCDQIFVRWPSGQKVETRFPKKGPIPHDAVHLIVEQELGLTKGFWGLVAAGLLPEAIQEMAKAGGHASASRCVVPDDDIVELIKAERLVECFESEFWGEPGDAATLHSVAQAACASSHAALPPLSDAVIAQIRTRMAALKADWLALPTGQSMVFDWHG